MKKLGMMALLGLCLLQSGCGGGGGAGSGSSGPSEIIYAVSSIGGTNTKTSTETCNTTDGCITEYAFNPSSGSFYNGEAQISTNGTNPIQMVFDPSGSYAYVLNNASPNGDISPHAGSIVSYPVTSIGLGTGSTPLPTGLNPYTMAVDSSGQYLVVANHGDGTSTGSVQVFSLSSGTVSSVTTSGSPCGYPDTVVFPSSTHTGNNEPVLVTCTSPEKVGGTTPTAEIFQCTIGGLESGGCGAVTITSSPLGSNSVLYNLVLNTSGTKAYAPGYDPTNGGIVLGFSVSNGSLAYTGYAILPKPGGDAFYPSGKIGIVTSGSTDYVLVGSYPSSTGTSNTITVCSVFSSTSGTDCSPTNTSTAYTFPLTFTVSSSNNVYVALTGQNISSGTNNGGTGGVLMYTESSITGGGSSIVPSQNLLIGSGTEPTEVTIDPTGNFAAIPYFGSTSIGFSTISGNELSTPGIYSVNGSSSLVYIH